MAASHRTLEREGLIGCQKHVARSIDVLLNPVDYPLSGVRRLTNQAGQDGPTKIDALLPRINSVLAHAF
jgi:hypothetical protein